MTTNRAPRILQQGMPPAKEGDLPPAVSKWCEECGNELTGSPSRIRRRKYCSHACYVKSRKGRPKAPGDKVRRWSAEDLTALTRLYAEKRPLSEIAKILGKSRGAVLSACQRYGLAQRGRYRKVWSDEDRAFVEEARQRGETNIEIAKALGVSEKSLSAKIAQWGIGLAIGSEELSAKATQRNARLWADPAHAFNQPAYREKLHAHWLDPNSIVNSAAYRQALSDRTKNNPSWFLNANPSKGRYKGGYRADLGFYVRSRWEANIARYLRWLTEKGEVAGFEYEAETFEFHAIKRGTRSYTPDFRVHNKDGTVEYWEVKGYMDAASRTKLKRMAKYHPGVKVVLLEREEYAAIRKWSRLIEHWDDDGLAEIETLKHAVVSELERAGWLVYRDVPYGDGPCIAVIGAIAIKAGTVLFVEVKTRTGQLSTFQRVFQQEIESQGLRYLVVRSVADAIAFAREGGQ